MSERKHKCSGNIDGTTIKIVLSCSAVFNFGNIWTVVSQAPLATGIVQTRIPEWVAMPYPGTARLKMYFFSVCVCF